MELPISYYIIASGINFITTLWLSIVVYKKSLRSKLTVTFSMFLFSAAWWSLFLTLCLSSRDRTLALFYFRTCMLGVLFMATLSLHFTTALLKINRKKFIIANYIVSVFFSLFLYSPLYVRDVSRHLVFPYWGEPGIIFHFSFAHFVLLALYVFYELLRGVIREKGILKNQIIYVAVGLFIGYGSGLINFLCWYRIPVTPFLNILISFSIYIFTFHGIVQYRLMGIKVAVKKLVTPIVSILILVFSLFILTKMFPVTLSHKYTFAEIMLSDLLLIIALFVFYKIASNFMDKYFPHRNYDALLYDYNRRMAQSNTTEEIFGHVIEILQDKDGPRVGKAIILYQKIENHAFEPQANFGMKEEDLKVLTNDSALVKFVELEFVNKESANDTAPILIKDELLKMYEHNMIGTVISEIDSFHAQLCIPLIYCAKNNNRQFFGMIFLGEPEGAEIYNHEDYEFFRDVAKEMSRMLVNVDARSRVTRVEMLANLGRMAMGWVHQINNILNRINILSRINGDLIKYDIVVENKEGKEKESLSLIVDNSAKIEENAVNGGKIANGLLKLTKTVREGEFSKISLSNVLKKSIEAVAEQGNLGYVVVENNVDNDLPLIDGIEHCLEEAFKNLLNNAARAVMQCRKEQDARIKIATRVTQDEKHIEVKLADNGKGMSKEDIKNLGMPLFMPSDGSAPSGHGIGVAVTYYYLMKVHKAKIDVESEKGKGTTFYITLPIKQNI